MSDLTGRVFELVNSSDINEQTGGIFAIGARRSAVRVL
jgi:hypothetical protein